MSDTDGTRRTWFLLQEGWIVLVLEGAEHIIPPRANGDPDHLAAQTKADGLLHHSPLQQRQGAEPSAQAVARAESAC